MTNSEVVRELKVAVVVLAAGTGTRFGHSTNKVWLKLLDRHIISYSLLNASKSFDKAKIILVINPDDQELAKSNLNSEIENNEIEIVFGGSTRHESEYKALQYLAPAISSGEIEVVLIHDGARPLATPDLFTEIAKTAFSFGGAIPAIELHPLEMSNRQEVRVVRVQTPQGFRAVELLAAYNSASNDGFVGTDTSACIEQYFPQLKIISVKSVDSNIKITVPNDLLIAEQLIMKHQ